MSYLEAKIMLDNGRIGFIPLVTIMEWLSVTLASKEFDDIRHISAFDNKLHGLMVKRPGNPATSVVWRLEGNELYLTAVGDGDQVSKVSDAERLQMDTVFPFTFEQSLTKLIATPPSRK